MSNMLKNGNFEADWAEENSHQCLVIPGDAPQYFTEVGNVFTPPGWVTWFRHDNEYAQPEVRDARAHDPDRMRSGEKGMLLFTFSRRHWGGFYQTVPVTPGERYRFTAWAHAWSNHKDVEKPDDFPHPDDPKWSEGAGYGPFFALEGEVEDDAQENFSFQLGIDPTGGTNPLSDSVVWGDSAHIYNVYAQVPAVEAVAQSDRITVFLLSSTLWPFKHNDAYWDDAELTCIEEPGVLECEPREPYARTYVLVSPEEMPSQIIEMAKPVPDIFRWTVGGSADDAGHGPGCSERNVLATNPHDWDGSLPDFFEQYYPGTNLTEISHANHRQLSGRLLSAGLKQHGVKLAWPLTRQDAIITSEFGVDRGTYIHEGLDLRASWAANHDHILAATSGKVIRAGEFEGEPFYGHQVRIETQGPFGLKLLVRYAHMVSGSAAVNVGDIVQVGQMLGKPDNTGNSTGDHLHVDVRITGPDIPADIRLYADPEMLIEFPPENGGNGEKPEVEPIFPKNAVGTFGMHRLGSYGGYNEFIAIGPPMFKTVLDISALGYVHARCPHTELVYRQWIPDQDFYRKNADPAKGAAGFVRHDNWLQNVIDHCEQSGIKRVWVESLNETYNHDYANNQLSMRFDLAFVREIAAWNASHDLDIRSVAFCAAVGNPQMPTEGGGEQMWQMLLPLFEALYEREGAAGYHPYWAASVGDPAIYQRTAKYLQNRWMAFDTWLRAHDVYVYWMLGETGACKGWTWSDENGEHVTFDPGSGWMRTGSLEKYWNEARDTQIVWRRWNEEHGGRAGGGALFQSGSTDRAWDSFALKNGNLIQFGNWIKESW